MVTGNGSDVDKLALAALASSQDPRRTSWYASGLTRQPPCHCGFSPSSIFKYRTKPESTFKRTFVSLLLGGGRFVACFGEAKIGFADDKPSEGGVFQPPSEVK